MAKRFIDNYDVILLDMGNTFMFDCDRFGDLDALQATYEQCGGKRLKEGGAGRILADVMVCMERHAANLAHRASFPSLLQMLCEQPDVAGLPAEELGCLVRAFASHEAGTIPASHVDVLHCLARTHRLGLVSNILAPSDVFRAAFEEAGIAELFETRIWSSDVGVWKPCPAIFGHALQAFEGVPRQRIVHVGDSFKSDVGGARGVGIGAVWISPDSSLPEGSACRPDLIVSDLRDLPGC